MIEGHHGDLKIVLGAPGVPCSPLHAPMDGLSCVLLASLTVLVYDTIDTFADQVNHVWAPPYSYGTFLYILLRYFPFVDGVMAVERAWRAMLAELG